MAIKKTAPQINAELGANDPAHITSGQQGMANATTNEAIKEVLKHGVPDWFSHPEHYKAMAQEDYARTKENSDRQVAEYKMPNQRIFTDTDARMRNPMWVKDLLFKLRENGLRCCVQQNKNSVPGTAGLFCIQPGRERLGLQLVTSVQAPAMYEWSVLREDEHGLPVGEKFIGWRNVCAALIRLGIWSEEKVHKVFGKPPLLEFTSHYYQNLHIYRHQLNGLTMAVQ